MGGGFIRNYFCRTLAVQGIFQTPSEKASRDIQSLIIYPAIGEQRSQYAKTCTYTHVDTLTHTEKLVSYIILWGHGVNKATDKIHK